MRKGILCFPGFGAKPLKFFCHEDAKSEREWFSFRHPTLVAKPLKFFCPRRRAGGKNFCLTSFVAKKPMQKKKIVPYPASDYFSTNLPIWKK